MALMHVLDACKTRGIDVALVQDIPKAVDTDSSSHAGYTFIGATVLPGTGREAGIFVNPQLHFSKSPESTSRAVGIELRWGTNILGIVSGYLQPVTALGLSELAALSQALKARTPFVFVGADVNGHSPSWGPLETIPNAQGNLVDDFIFEANFEILNCPDSSATFMPSVGDETWIDVSLATRPLASLVSHWEVLGTYFYSDHRAILTEFDVVPVCTMPRRALNWKVADWDLLKRTLVTELEERTCQALTPLTPTALDTMVAGVSAALGRAVAVAVPYKRPSRFSKPWWNPTLTRLRRDANKAYYKWRRTRWEWDRTDFVAKRRAYKTEISAAKKRLWMEFCEGLTPSNAWTRIKRISGQPCHRPIAALKTGGGGWVSDDASKAQVLGSRFFPQDDQPLTAAHQTTIEDVTQWLGEHPAAANALPPVSMAEVQASLLHIRAFGAPGFDGIMDELLRQTSDVLLPFVTALAQSSLQLQYFPLAWKRALTIPIPKEGCDLEDAGGYRPISLLSVLGKVVEHIVTKRLTFWLESGKKLSQHQYGFRKQKSTELALWNFVGAAYTAMLGRRQLGVVSLDLKSAYDSVWGAGLVSRMIALGAPSYLVRWVSSFIDSRTAVVVVGEGASSWALSRGVPQGSPLSPVLFLVFIDPALEGVREFVFVQAYADDLLIWVDLDASFVGWENLQAGLCRLERWAGDWRMTFNPHKTVLVWLHRLRPSSRGPLPSLQFCGRILEPVPTLKYLGLLIDSELCWGPHIQMVCNQARRRLHAIKRVCGMYWGAHPRILRQLVEGIVLPTLFYAAPAWVAASPQ